MTKREYLEEKVKEIIDNLSKSEIPSNFRQNQEQALMFFITELKSLNK